MSFMKRPENNRQIETKSKLYYDRQSGTHLGPATNFSPYFFNYFLTVTDLFMWGALSDEKSGL
jgi:hypothetical protein